MDDPQLRRTAHHESGHVVMAHLLGWGIGPVTIIRGNGYNGLACYNGMRFSDKERGKLGLPVPLLPARFRRAVETNIMVSLAGRMAERWDLEPVSGFIPEHPDERYAQKLARLAAPTERDTRLLTVPEGRKVEPDEETAATLTRALAGDDTATRYLLWLQAETAALVATPRFGRLVAALVPVLLEHKTLSGRATRIVLVEAERRR
jgi:hypothetical protein